MEDELVVRRLGWAGIQLSLGGSSMVVDLLEERHSMAPVIEEVGGPLPPPQGEVRAALVTHLHADHADPAAVGRALAAGGSVLRPGPATGGPLDRAATAVAEAGLAKLDASISQVGDWDSRAIGPFTVTAVPAVDGFGDPQVSWVVEGAGRRVLHAGDTLNHGAWWPIASRLGPFDAAFLPVNAAICEFPHRRPASPFPASLTAEQAAVAAAILGAEAVVPIHYDGIHQPGVYEQAEDPVGALRAAIGDQRRVEVLEPGEALEWRD